MNDTKVGASLPYEVFGEGHKYVFLSTAQAVIAGLEEQLRNKQRLLEELDIPSLQRKANLVDAFTSLGRIRTLGTARLGEAGYQHMGFEIWTLYGHPGEYNFTDTNAEALKNLEILLNAWAKSPKHELRKP